MTLHDFEIATGCEGVSSDVVCQNGRMKRLRLGPGPCFVASISSIVIELTRLAEKHESEKWLMRSLHPA